MSDPNPITQRLTRNTNQTVRRVKFAAAIVLPIAVMVLINVVSSLSLLAPTTYGVVLLLVVILGLNAAVQTAAGVASSILAHREIWGESFEVFRLTTISSREVAAGLVAGVRYRVLPLVVAADSLAAATVGVPLLGLIIRRQFFVSLWDGPGITLLTSLLALVVTHWLTRADVVAGMYLATRYRQFSSGTVTLISAGAVIAFQFLCPFAAGILYGSRSSDGAGCFILALPLIYFTAAHFGVPAMIKHITRHIERARLGGE